MRKKIDTITEQLNTQFQAIDTSEMSILKKAEESVLLLEAAFEQLKNFIYGYTFESEAEEIHFFKEVKPKMFHKLIYYRKIYSFEALRPNGSISVQKNYIEKELDHLKYVFDKNIDFYKYYRSESTHLDRYYFLRGKPDIQMILETFYFERDPKFSTSCDFKVAKVLANELLRIYFNEELMALEHPQHPQSDCYPSLKAKETWTRNKTDLVELIYAICEADCFNFGRISRIRLTEYFENVFNIDLGDVYHTYLTLRGRVNRTQFLDELKDKLIAKMDKDDSK